ncbi:MAG: hypothetical protein QOF51_4153 [Chloroflexota bacterium]|nr:hypothetical protein [Chloroflexota bacterium]
MNLSPDQPDSVGDDTPEALRRALADAQQRLAYYERFGSVLQAQMDAVVNRAAAITRENEEERDRVAGEVDRLRVDARTLRDEAQALRQECELHRQESARILLELREETAGILARARDATTQIVGRTVEQLAALENEVGRGAVPQPRPEDQPAPPSPIAAAEHPGDVQVRPPFAAFHADAGQSPIEEDSDTASFGSLTVVAPTIGLSADPGGSGTSPWVQPDVVAGPPSIERGGPSTPLAERAAKLMSFGSESEATSANEAEPQADLGAMPGDDATITRLRVRPLLPDDQLARLQRAVRSLAGIRGAELSSSSDEAVDLAITHDSETSLLGSLLGVSGLDFRVLARDDAFLEIRLLRLEL